MAVPDPDIEEILGSSQNRHYGAGWRSRALAVRDIQLQMPELQADADFAVIRDGGLSYDNSGRTVKLYISSYANARREHCLSLRPM